MSASRIALVPALAFATAVTSGACATTHLAEPLGAGRTRIDATLGGPLLTLGSITTPVPLTTLGVTHGMRDDLDLRVGIHPTALAFDAGNGSIPVLGLDVGGALHPIPNHLRALTLGATLYGFTNRVDSVLIADAWVGTGVRPTRWLFLSAGLHNGIRMGTTDLTLASRSVWAPSAYALVSFGPISGRTKIDLEARWYGFAENANRTAPGWVTIGDYGVFGVLLGVSYEFGDAQ